MSFDEIAKGQAQRSVGSPPSGQDDPLVRMIEKQIREIQQSCVQIKQVVETKLGTEHDDHDLRDRLRQQTTGTQKIINQVHEKLKQLTARPQPEFKASQDKLKKDFAAVLQQFKTVTKLSSEKQQALVAREKTVSRVQKDASQSDSDATESDALLAEQARRQKQMQLQNEISYNQAVIAEREEGIQEIESTLKEVNLIFRDLASMVNKQGEALDLMEDHVETTMMHTQAANTELKKAINYQASSRKKMCCLLFILVLIVGAIVVYFTVISR